MAMTYLREHDPIEAFCRIQPGLRAENHDPVLPYNTNQVWSFCQHCGHQIWRQDYKMLWIIGHYYTVIEWP